MNETSSAGPFPPTLWTEIRDAKEGDEPARKRALDALFRAYWRPIYAAVRFGWSRAHEDAKDLTQAFVADLIEREFWKEIDPAAGRFRSFLKAAVKNFMSNERDARTALKRGGGRTAVPLEEIREIPNPSLPGSSPEQILDDEWVQNVLSKALERLRRDYPPEQGHAYFDVFRLYYLERTDRPTHAYVAQTLGLSENSVRYYLAEAKAKLRAILTEIVRQYALGGDSVEEELRFLLG